MLICKNESCGGPGFVASGGGSMPATSAQGVRMVLSDPNFTNVKLLETARLLAGGTPQLTSLNGQIISARKQANSIVLTLTFSKVMPEIGLVQGVAHAVCTTSRIDVVIAAGPTLAKARERLSLGGS